MKIFMWHYVLDKTNNYHYFPLSRFEKFVKKEAAAHRIIGTDEFIFKINHKMVDSDDIVLTFDDGTIDHFNNVYPILKYYNVTGLFFVCSNIFSRELLWVHAIHMLLANVNFEKLYQKFQEFLKTDDLTLQQCKFNVTYDTDPKVVLFKKFLQTNLKNGIGIRVINHLLTYFNINIDPNMLYLSTKQLDEMSQHGMVFGSHTEHHYKLTELTEDEQKAEIVSCAASVNKYDKEGNKFFAYPYGDYNQQTLNILQKEKFTAAFTVQNKEFTKEDHHLLIPRLDCNVLF